MLADQCRSSDGETEADGHADHQHVDADVVSGKCLGAVEVADDHQEYKKPNLEDDLLHGRRVADVQQAAQACRAPPATTDMFYPELLLHPQTEQ